MPKQIKKGDWKIVPQKLVLLSLQKLVDGLKNIKQGMYGHIRGTNCALFNFNTSSISKEVKDKDKDKYIKQKEKISLI